jgi:hypothetical protein
MSDNLAATNQNPSFLTIFLGGDVPKNNLRDEEEIMTN